MLTRRLVTIAAEAQPFTLRGCIAATAHAPRVKCATTAFSCGQSARTREDLCVARTIDNHSRPNHRAERASSFYIALKSSCSSYFPKIKPTQTKAPIALDLSQFSLLNITKLFSLFSFPLLLCFILSCVQDLHFALIYISLIPSLQVD